jgi:hypothetical protein
MGKALRNIEKVFRNILCASQPDRRLIGSPNPNCAAQHPSDASARIGRPGTSSSVANILGLPCLTMRVVVLWCGCVVGVWANACSTHTSWAKKSCEENCCCSEFFYILYFFLTSKKEQKDLNLELEWLRRDPRRTGPSHVETKVTDRIRNCTIGRRLCGDSDLVSLG